MVVVGVGVVDNVEAVEESDEGGGDKGCCCVFSVLELVVSL